MEDAVRPEMKTDSARHCKEFTFDFINYVFLSRLTYGGKSVEFEGQKLSLDSQQAVRVST